MIQTPYYQYDIDALKRRIDIIKESLAGIPLTFSIKANSFILTDVVEMISHVEVCSPGELATCIAKKIPPQKIIYSGVMKEDTDVRKAISYGVDIVTLESKIHYEIVRKVVEELHTQVKVILRLSSGNQFGMSKDDLFDVIEQIQSSQDNGIVLYGLHYYSGTNKSQLKKIEKDLQWLDEVLVECKERFAFTPQLVEMGPGFAVSVFGKSLEELEVDDVALLGECSEKLIEFAAKYPLGIEMGRFIAAPCGTYFTKVKDMKEVDGVNYVIVDGGIHHLKYYGQMMAMQVPPITQDVIRGTQEKEYCICGSLCTVADVLVRSVSLHELQVGDVLAFHKCGAYSATEASALFLSRDLPNVIKVKNGQMEILRKDSVTHLLNS